MESEAKLLLDAVESLRAGTGELEKICKGLTHLTEEPELFDRAVVHAQFTIWMTLGDKDSSARGTTRPSMQLSITCSRTGGKKKL